MSDPAADFLRLSRHYLREYVAKIGHCLERLPEQDLWWKPNDASNSAGNLLLHLRGNVRQWILTGIGGQADARDRDSEFAAESGANGEELMAGLRETLEEVDRFLAELPAERLGQSCTIQGREFSAQEAVYHVVEHFAMHAGQILWITKARAGEDLGFYGFQDGVPRAQW